MAQVIILFALEILMLLFRIAVPIRATTGQMQWFIGEMIYLIIEGFLVIILVNHLIFKRAYSEMGLTRARQQFYSLLGNLCYLGIIAGVTYGLNFISGEKNSHSIGYMISRMIVLFISTAFLQEVIFRGCILNNLLKFTRNKVFLSVIGATLLFMIIYIPHTMLQTNFESLFKRQTGQLVYLSFGMGIYLSLLYYWTKNIWLCMIIHGTYNSIDIVANGLLKPAFKGAYILGALIYLVYVAIMYIRGKGQVDEEANEDTKANEDKKVNKDKATNEDLGKHEDSALDDQVRQTEEELQYKEKVNSKQKEKPDTEKPSAGLEDLSKIAVIPLEEQKKPLKREQTHHEKDLSQTMTINVKELEKANKKDLSQTTMINLKELEAASRVDLSQTTIIKIAELEAAEKALQVKQLILPQPKVETDTFKEEPSYINHLEHSLGEFETIYKQVIPSDPPIDILSFQGERFNALVTNGMRYLPMNVPEYQKGDAYAELVMFIDKRIDISDEGLLREENSWLLQSLRDLAMYPRQTNGYIGWGHVVGNGEERAPYYRGSEFCGMLIYPPVVQDDMKFYTFKEDEKTTYIYNVMPLYTEEIDFILTHSSETYFEQMRQAGISQIIKRDRPSACL